MTTTLKTRRLSGREESFCQLMSILGDDSLPQKECAIEAGYGRSGAHVRASQLMKRVRIRDRIEELQAKHMRRKGITKEGIIADLITAQEKTLTEGKYGDYIRATELLGKTMGLFKEVTINHDADIQDIINIEHANELRIVSRERVLAPDCTSTEKE